jgi:dolichol kinase
MKKLSKGIKARKFLHLLTASLPIVYLHIERKEMLIALALLTCLSFLADILRLEVKLLGTIFYRFFEKLLWEKEKRIFTGASIFFLSASLAVFLFSKPVAIASLLFLAVGDTTAYFVGTRFGRISISGEKTLEGSLSCLLLCIIISLFVPNLPFLVLLCGAFAASIVELFPLGVDDNLVLPLVSGFVMEAIRYILV